MIIRAIKLSSVIFVVIMSSFTYGNEIGIFDDKFASSAWHTVKNDYSAFYSQDRLL